MYAAGGAGICSRIVSASCAISRISQATEKKEGSWSEVLAGHFPSVAGVTVAGSAHLPVVLVRVENAQVGTGAFPRAKVFGGVVVRAVPLARVQQQDAADGDGAQAGQIFAARHPFPGGSGTVSTAATRKLLLA